VFDAHHIDRSDGIADLVDALSDTPVASETDAWFIGHARSAAVLARRLAALMPDVQPIARTERMAGWASRHRNATIVYWRQDGALELTVDDDVDQAIARPALRTACRPTTRQSAGASRAIRAAGPRRQPRA
jgi:hypothetical protein